MSVNMGPRVPKDYSDLKEQSVKRLGKIVDDKYPESRNATSNVAQGFFTNLWKGIPLYIPFLNWSKRTTLSSNIITYYVAKVQYIAQRTFYEYFDGTASYMKRVGVLDHLIQKEIEKNNGEPLTVERKSELISEARVILDYEEQVRASMMEQRRELTADELGLIWEMSKVHVAHTEKKSVWPLEFIKKKISKLFGIKPKDMVDAAEKMVEHSQTRFGVELDAAKERSIFPVLPSHVQLTPVEALMKTKKSYISKQMVEQMGPGSVEARPRPIILGGQLCEMVASGYNLSTGRMETGLVTPTDLRNRKGVDSDHLCNIHTVDTSRVAGAGPAVVRTGVIDSEVKAEEFYKELQKLEGMKRNGVLRVSSLQLNSYENESGMIEGQHKALQRLNVKYADVKVVHLNTPSNAWVHFTEKAEKTLGKTGVGILSATGLFASEKKSREMNLDSWSVYAGWLVEDLGAHAPASLTEKVIKANKLREEIYESLEKKDSSRVSKLRAEMKTKLTEIYEELGTTPNNPRLEATELLRRVLDVQLGINKLGTPSRGQEGMMIQMLNSQLGVVSAMNCKSGLDRTGIWHAVKLALIGRTKPLDMATATNWDDITSEINRITVKHGPDAILEILTGYESRNAGTIAALRQKYGIPEGYEDGRLVKALRFRVEVLENLITSGHSVTVNSTGVKGFKWGKGREENRIPLNFIPSHIQKVDKEEKLVVDENGLPVYTALVNYDAKTGEALSLTQEGRRLLVQYSLNRGS